MSQKANRKSERPPRPKVCDPGFVSSYSTTTESDNYIPTPKATPSLRSEILTEGRGAGRGAGRGTGKGNRRGTGRGTLNVKEETGQVDEGGTGRGSRRGLEHP